MKAVLEELRKKRDMTCRKQIAQQQEKNSSLSVITLHVNGLNSPITRQILAKWILKRHDLTICCLQETQFRPRDK